MVASQFIALSSVPMREEHEGYVFFAVSLVVPFLNAHEFFKLRVVVEGIEVEEVGKGD